MIKYLLILFSALSVLAILLYASDKRKAKRKRWRIPEKLLLGVGFFGGAVGALIGMNLFRHKTKHWYFWAVNLLGLAWQVALVVFLYGK
jgi:uncharacterized membrane protein YsdA (DUF1294 family)